MVSLEKDLNLDEKPVESSRVACGGVNNSSVSSVVMPRMLVAGDLGSCEFSMQLSANEMIGGNVGQSNELSDNGDMNDASFEKSHWVGILKASVVRGCGDMFGSGLKVGNRRIRRNQTCRQKRMIRKVKKGVNVIMYGDEANSEDIFDSSVSDKEIAFRNRSILREAESNVGVGAALGFEYSRNQAQLVEIVSWNVRGLGRVEKKKVVRKLFSKVKFDFMVLQETKIKELSPRFHRWLWENEPVLSEVVLSEGNAGGLISCWREEFFTLETKFVSQRFILLVGRVKGHEVKCGFGNVYAPNV
ncbi:hypothetical protein PTKIN_Ptkin14bG0176700 [Pterospermum kingtungense]